MRQLTARIIKNEKIAHGFFKMRIESNYIAKNAKPGQFIEVKCSDGIDPLLRRPLGTHRILSNGIELLYEVVGKGTKLLSQKKRDSYLDIIGPLGNGFDIKTIDHRPKTMAILIAGGIGVAPLVALAQALRKKKIKTAVIIGARTKSQVMCESEFKSLGCDMKVATEDGSKGHKGLATDLLKFLVSTIDHRPSTIYGCGPNGMLKEVAAIARAKRIPCQVSLEERMACGVGVCLGCPVKLKTHSSKLTTQYKMVCKDGPVFNAEEIIL